MSPDSKRLAVARRREATKAAIRYFALFFSIFLALGCLTVYTVRQARQDAAQRFDVRMEYCRELEKLKADNRADLAREKKNYRRNLRLLGIKNTPQLRRAAREEWDIKARRNAPKPCPYSS